MSDPLPWLIGLVLLALLAFLYWSVRRYPDPSKPRERPHYLTYCAWCIHRDGDLCTHPGSPVYPDECHPWHTGAACTGATRCHVRENLHTQNPSAPAKRRCRQSLLAGW